ncbi:MAG: hypothetical protein R3E77_06550 [Steroidobacteraceae bacterium]
MRIKWLSGIASLWRLSPGIAEHIALYGSLIRSEAARLPRQLLTMLVGALASCLLAVVTIGGAFAILVAWYWDTPHRLAVCITSIGSLTALSAAALHRSNRALLDLQEAFPLTRGELQSDLLWVRDAASRPEPDSSAKDETDPVHA